MNLVTKTCGEETSNNCTYFQNNGFPSTFDSVGSCQLTVNKMNGNICQLRLDFENLILAQPEATDHVCQVRRLKRICTFKTLFSFLRQINLLSVEALQFLPFAAQTLEFTVSKKVLLLMYFPFLSPLTSFKCHPGVKATRHA